MHRQTGWPETPLDSLEHRKEAVLGEGRVSAASPAKALRQLPARSPACQGSGWSACCPPAAAAAFSSSEFRHSGSFRIPVPALSPLLCQTNVSPFKSQLRSSSRRPSPSLPCLASSAGSGDPCPPRGFCASCVTALITLECQGLFTGPCAPPACGVYEGRSHAAAAHR